MIRGRRRCPPPHRGRTPARPRDELLPLEASRPGLYFLESALALADFSRESTPAFSALLPDFSICSAASPRASPSFSIACPFFFMLLPAASSSLLPLLSPASCKALPFFSILAPLAFSASADFSSLLPFFSMLFPAFSAGEDSAL